MPTEKEIESKLKLFAAAAKKSTNEQEENFPSVGDTNGNIEGILSLREIEEIESCDDAPIPLFQKKSGSKQDSTKKLNSSLIGSLKNGADNHEPEQFVDSALMGAKHDALVNNEYKESEEYDDVNEADDTISFHLERHHDQPNLSCESSVIQERPDRDAREQEWLELADDNNNGSNTRAESQLMRDFQPQDSKEISIPEATLVSNKLDAIVIPDEDIVNISTIPINSNVNLHEHSSALCKGRRRILILGAIFVLILVITLSVLLRRDNNNTVPFIPTHDSILQIIKTQSDFNQSSLMNENSYQSRALDWLVNDMVTNNVTNKITVNSPEIVERFSLVVLYYALNGAMWDDQINFLSENHVCDWKKGSGWYTGKGVVSCTSDMRIDRLQLPENNLQGSLPSEIGLLKDLVYLDLGVNSITGFLPSFESLTKLKELYLNSNGFIGTIHRSLQELIYLETLYLNNNNLNGELIDVTNMTDLKFINFRANALTGKVPSSYGSLRYLGELNLDDNLLSGSVDFLYPLMEKELMRTLKKRYGDLNESADFLCPMVIEDYETKKIFNFDCTGTNELDTKITCNSCCWCTFVSENDCDPEKQIKIYYNISVGQDAYYFTWQIKRMSNENSTLLFAGGDYDRKNNVHLQMCLDYPRVYNLGVTNHGTAKDGSNLTEVVLSNGISFIVTNAMTSLGSSDIITFVTFSLSSDGLLLIQT